MRIPRSVPVVVAAIGCCVALSGTAVADTAVSTTIGPVTIPSVPLSLCITVPGVPNKCVPTPSARSVTLTVSATALTPAAGTTPPTITKVACPAGTSGAAAEVATGSSTVTVVGTAAVTVTGLSPITLPIAPAVATPGRTVKVYACTGAS
jgi:hypothetical protein